MAQKFYSQYTAEEIEQILNDSDLMPFVIYYDKKNMVYRFFRTPERRDIWVEAFESGNMTEEIAAYEFTDSFTAPAPYTINISGLKDNQYILYGSTGTFIEFTFQTVDGNGGELNESVDVYYTIKTPVGTATTSNIYNAGAQARLNIDDYLALGTNVITILVRGRSTGTTKAVVVTYYMVELSLSSTFDISKSIQKDSNFSVTYTVRGQSDKTVEFYIDGHLEVTASVSQLQSEATRTEIFNNSEGKWGPGRHTLQMRANMMAGDQQFYSNILYYEFVITGIEQTVILISEIFPASTGIIVGVQPGLTGEQYVTRTLNWAYYSSDPLLQTATITWRLYVETSSGSIHETTLATRNADVVTAESDRAPEPLNFMPTEIGDYKLQGMIGGNVIEPDYTISIIANTNNLYETTEAMSLKLTGLGRSNDEPEDTKTSWANNGYYATFYNQPWNDNSGWKDDALVLNNGATAIVNIQPYSGGGTTTVDAADKNGCVVEVDFETFNVTETDCVLFKIGDVVETAGNEIGTQLIIKPSGAYLRSRLGTMKISTNFKSDERVKLAFVVYPKASTGASPYKQNNYVFIYSNGVMSAVQEYDSNDDFVSSSFIELGNAIVRNNTTGVESSVCGTIPEGTSITGMCDAGIKIYYLRVYRATIDMYSELNNFIIDSGVNLSRLVAKNDIYTPNTRTISVDKLEGSITTVKITGALDEIIGPGKGRDIKLSCGLEVVCPSNSSINMSCAGAVINKAGQSTLDKPVPSFHVKLDKNNNVCYDRDGKILTKNRWAFREGNVPEKKFRLQANYMDSSGAHNGAFMRLFGEVGPKVTINGSYVLRTPAEQYAYEEYPKVMQALHGDDPRGLGWAFPYTLHMIPDSIPCVVVWRETDKDSYKFLGQYVIMEEKKATFSSGLRSIYDTVDENGYPDPFQFKSKIGNRLWDNKDCHQMELLTSTDDLTLFLDDSDWDRTDENGDLLREKMFELIYPDEDDLMDDDPSGALVQAEWKNFYDTFVHPVCSTKGSTKYHDDIDSITGNQEAFNALYGTRLDRWHFAAYYCLALRNCCSDSMARNIELTTYDGQTWLPKWWDVDMECGLYQTGDCNLEPMTTRNTIAPGTNNSFALSGRGYVSGKLHSSWLWDGLEGCSQFQEDVKAMDKALYQAGWNYTNMNKLMDDEYVGAWSQSLYNESGITKYLDYNQKINLQGDRTPHRHWFLKTSYDYFDAINVCGEYTSKTINIRTEIPYYHSESNPSLDVVHSVTLKAGVDSFFGWGTSISNDLTGIPVSKGETRVLQINRALQLNNPLHIFAASKLEELDFSDISQFMAADLDLSKTYDSVTGTYLRKVILGISKENMRQGIFNRYNTLNIINGIEYLTKVEYFDIQGLNYIRSLDFSKMTALKKLYAAGTSMTNFNPAGGSNLQVAELPTTITTMSMDGCSLNDGTNHCSIVWYQTTEGSPHVVTSYYISVVGGWRKLENDEIPGDTSGLPKVNSIGELYDIVGVPLGTIYKVETTEYNMSIEEATIPTTLKSLSLTGMGSDKGTQDLVVSWIDAISDLGDDSVFQDYSLVYTGIQGNNLEVFDISTLLSIAKIPDAKRRLTGYLICRGTGQDGAFTAEEMNLLMNAFGRTIFTLGSTLCIDCVAGGVLVSAVGSDTTIDDYGVMRILQGTSATLSASGFPLRAADSEYVWAILDENGTYHNGTESTPIISYKNVELHYTTGALNTIEGDYDDLEFTIFVSRYVEGILTGTAELPINILKRSYPSSVSLSLTNIDPATQPTIVEIVEGVYQIKVSGTYIFDAVYSPSEFNGTLLDTGGGVWSLSNFNQRYVRREEENYGEGKNSDNEYRLVVTNMPDSEVNMTLGYTANWKNLTSNTATPIQMTLARIVGVLSNNPATGNPALFNIIDKYGVSHGELSESYFTSLELKRATGTINFKSIADEYGINLNTFRHLYSGEGSDPYKFNIASYMINVTGLNLSNCSYLERDVDISGDNKYELLYLDGTSVNAILGIGTKLQDLRLGTPSEISIISPLNLRSIDISVQDSSELTSLTLVDLRDNKTFSEAAEIIEAGADDSLTHFDIEQDRAVTETVNSKVIDNLASVVDQKDGTSKMIGRLSSEYLYEASKTKLSVFPNLTIDNTGYYIPFVDSAFREVVASTWGDGAGLGLRPSQVSSVTSLGNNVHGNTGISNLSDLDSLTSLNFNTDKTTGNATFGGCTNLASIKFPASTTTIGAYTFENNDKLVTLDFSGCTELTEIKENAFSGCDGKANINLSSCSSLVSANLLGFSDPGEIVIEGNNSITTLII